MGNCSGKGKAKVAAETPEAVKQSEPAPPDVTEVKSVGEPEIIPSEPAPKQPLPTPDIPWGTQQATLVSTKEIVAAAKSPQQVLKVGRTLKGSPPPSNLDGNGVKSRAIAIANAIDSLLMPLIDAIDKFISSNKEVDGRTWEDVRIVDLGNEIFKRAEAKGISIEQLNDMGGLVEAALPLWEDTFIFQGQEPVPESVFYCQSINRLVSMVSVVLCRNVTVEDQVRFSQKWNEWEELCTTLGVENQYQLSVLLNPPSKSLVLYATMIKTTGDSKVKFTVSRKHVLEDSLSTWANNNMMRTSKDKSCKVFPSFQNEDLGDDLVEPGEGHGPRKEFFLLVGKQLAENPMAEALFPYDSNARHYWFNSKLKDSDENKRRYRYFGWLLAQSLMNRSILGIQLPEALFNKLLQGKDYKPTLDRDLVDFDPGAAQSLENVRGLSFEEFQQLLSMEDLGGISKDEYINRSVTEVLVTSVRWQFRAVKEGFDAVLQPSVLESFLITGPQLMEMVCGPDTDNGNFKIQGVFRVVMDDELRTPENKALAETLWSVLEGWPIDLKRSFVKFVSGSERIPAFGSEVLLVQMPFTPLDDNDWRDTLGQLPQAHTCENILELPNYWEALRVVKGKQSKSELCKIIDDRFKLALSELTYGLDDLTGAQTYAGASDHTGPGFLDMDTDRAVKDRSSPDTPRGPHEGPDDQQQQEDDAFELDLPELRDMEMRTKDGPSEVPKANKSWSFSGMVNSYGEEIGGDDEPVTSANDDIFRSSDRDFKDDIHMRAAALPVHKPTVQKGREEEDVTLAEVDALLAELETLELKD